MTWLSVMSQLVSATLGAVATPTGLAGLAAMAVTGLLLVVLVRHACDLADPATSPTRTRAIALRERSRHTAFLRLRDPDAPGRTRSRAPGSAAAA
jgi:hypothetical protein